MRAQMQAQRQQRTERSNGQQQAEQQSNQGAQQSSRAQGQTIWVLVEGKKLEPRFIRAGLTNGRVTEVVAGSIQEGETVVIGKNSGDSAKSPQQAASPFGQQPGGRGAGRGRTR